MKKQDAKNLIIVALIIGLIASIWETIKPTLLNVDKIIFPKEKFKNKTLYSLRWYICLFIYFIGYIIYLYNFI
jgi:hypothetical protein